MAFSLPRALAVVGLASCGTSLVALAQNPLINSAPSGIATVPGQSRGTSGGGFQSSFASLLSTEVEYDFGRTQGAFGVSSSGAATYTIPIWTPPGPNGVQPSIALTYSSQGGNGLAGVGWNLSAVSAIERCARTQHQDGYGAAVGLTTNDRLCIGGNRLRLSSGTYGASGAVYFTEFADYSRITAHSYSGGGEYFVVEAKSGLKYEYGNSTSSRVVLGTAVLRWMLSKVSDRNGNNYVIAYNNNGTGFAVPDVISWTPTYHGSASYRYEAKFNYLTMRTDEDSYIGKIAGFDVSNRYRLESIDIKSAGVVKRHYPLAYDESPATKRSRLTSVKECADDVVAANCFLPLTFEYQSGESGISGTPVSGVSSSASLVPGKFDFNGDGKSDLLYVSGSTWHVSFSTGSGFAAGVNTGVASSATHHVHRLLATHQDGLLVDVSGTWNYVGFDGSSFVTTSTGIPVPTGGVSGQEPMVTDNNGDGIADIVWGIGGNVMLRLNNTTGSASVPSFGNAITAASFSVGHGNVAIMNAQNCLTARMCDLNGDGRGELMVNVVSVTDCGVGGCTIIDTKYDLFANGTGYSAGPLIGSIGYRGMHFNDDRCIDRVQNAAPSTLQIAGCDNAAPSTISLPTSGGIYMDWNGDGHTDIVVNSAGYFGFYLSKGNAAAPFASLVTTTIPISSSCSYFVFDADGDGLDDLGCVGTSSPYAVSYYPRAGSGGVYLTQEPDLLSSVTDGFGVNDSPSYVSTSQNNYIRGTGTQLPLLDATAPITVVAEVTSSNGIGGTYSKTYSYRGARVNRERGESAGFQRVDEVDSRNGLISRTYFDQAFPIAGMVSKTELMQPNGTTTIAREVFTNSSAALDDTAYNQRYFAYTSASTATQYEVGGAFNGALLRTVSTENLFDNTSGTLYDKTVTTTEPASGANGINAGGIWESRTYLPLSQLVNNTENWCMGRPKQTQEINSSNQEFDDEITRTTEATWNVTYCRLTQSVNEPGDELLEVTTDIGYDTFGNVDSTTVTGIGMEPRESSAEYSDGTFTTGQFPLSLENALEQTSTIAWDYDLGVPESTTDPNGITTSWSYDAYGRKTGETWPDGTSSSLTYKDCAAVNACGGFIKTQTVNTEYDDSQAVVSRTEVYQNSMGQEVERWQSTTNNLYVFRMTYYDALGRVALSSAPCLANGTDCNTLFWTTNEFDQLNRTTAVSRRKAADDSNWQTTYFNFKGLMTEVVDPQGKVTLSIANALGQIARSQDHDSYYQNFDYDSFGNVKRIADSAATLQTSNYNLRGMLTSRTDMDMGTWGFAPNALGEIVSQTDAKSQTTTFEFDKVGRLKKRIEPDGTSEWKWGVLANNTSTNKYVGRLKEMTGPGYAEAYSYDVIARPLGTTITAGDTYQIDYSYNSMGALDTLTYPESTSSFRLKLKYEYSNGYLTSIKQCATSACTTFGTSYWTADKYTARGQIKEQTLGNDLVVLRDYDLVTGWLKSIRTGLTTDFEVQKLDYKYDLMGNLKERKDLN
jgi:YD repeat-containing protein